MNIKKIIFLMMIYLLSFSYFAVAWWIFIRNDHGRLAKKAEKCIWLPMPRLRCDHPIDSLDEALEFGAKEPDDRDGLSSPKHSLNKGYDKYNWPPIIRAYYKVPNATIGPGLALESISK